MQEIQKLLRNPFNPQIASEAAFLSIAAIFALPVFCAVFLTSWDGNFPDWQNVSRLFFLPALYVEIAICIIAAAKGLNFVKFAGEFPMSVQILSVLWLLVLCASTFFADANKSAAILGAVFWAVHFLFFLAILYMVKEAGSEALQLEKLAIILPASTAIAGFVIFVFANAKGLDGDVEWIAYLPGFAHIRHTGYVFAPAIAISLAHMAARPAKFGKMHMLLLILNCALMLWLGSRGPVFGCLVAVAVCMVGFSEMRSIRFLSRAAFAGTCGALLSILAPLPQHGAFGALQRFWNASSDPTEFSSGRLNFWIETVNLIGQRPLFGHGPLQFQFISSNAAGIYKHPHNSILQFMFDWGLLGGLSFLMLMAFAAYAAFFKAKCSSYIKLISAMGFATMAAFSLIDGLFFYSYPIAISTIFLVIPIATGLSWSKKSI